MELQDTQSCIMYLRSLPLLQPAGTNLNSYNESSPQASFKAQKVHSSILPSTLYQAVPVPESQDLHRSHNNCGLPLTLRLSVKDARLRSSSQTTLAAHAAFLHTLVNPRPWNWENLFMAINAPVSGPGVGPASHPGATPSTRFDWRFGAVSTSERTKRLETDGLPSGKLEA